MGKGLARFGGAENCLWITITDTELWVCPHFPFNLGGLPEKLRLEHRIRGTDIISVEHKTYMWGFRRVLIHARDPMGTEEAFEISIRDVDAFDRAMERIRNPGAKS